MKKLFAFALCMVLMLSNLVIQAEAVTTNEQTNSRTTNQLTSAKVEVPENGKLTLEFLSKISSWKELVDTALPIDEDYGRISNREDFCVVMLIKEINKAFKYYNTKNVKINMKGLNIEGTDYERLNKKFENVINLFNREKSLHIVWESNIIGANLMQVMLRTVDTIEMRTGQKVALKLGTKYWESSLNEGSGKFGIVTDTECKTPGGFIVTVNGFSYLGWKKTYINESEYISYDELNEQEAKMEGWKGVMIHVCKENMDLGWVHLEDIAKFDCE